MPKPYPGLNTHMMYLTPSQAAFERLRAAAMNGEYVPRTNTEVSQGVAVSTVPSLTRHSPTQQDVLEWVFMRGVDASEKRLDFHQYFPHQASTGKPSRRPATPHQPCHPFATPLPA